MSTNPRIAIIGAGPAGLTLASLLAKHKLPYTAFDLRPSPSSPSSSTSPLVPSASLDLHHESGLLALKACGLYETFQKLQSHCSEANIVTNKHGEVKWQDDGMGGERPEIARNDLTTLLQGSFDSSAIKWEHKLLSISSSPSIAAYTLHLSHHGQQIRQEFDLVVGADGAWSKVRPLMTDVKPVYSGMNGLYLTLANLSAHPRIMKFIGSGTFSACGDGKAVMAQRSSLDTVRIYLMLKFASSTYLSETGLLPLVNKPEELSKKLIEDPALFESWGDEIKDLIRTACSSVPPAVPIIAEPMHNLPLPFTAPTHKKGLTLLGDAGHLMTPFAGEGVNMAMADALSLATALSNSTGGWDEAIRTHEEKMWERVVPFMEESISNMEMIFGEDAPAEFVRFFESHAGGPGPE